MKGRWYSIAAALLTACTLTACDSKVKEVAFENPFNEIATLHSRGLNHALEFFRANPIPRENWLAQFKEQAISAVTEFGLQTGLDPDKIEEVIAVGLRSVTTEREELNIRYDYSSVQEVIDIYVDDPATVLMFIERLEYIIISADDIVMAMDALANLEWDAHAVLSANDSSVVLWAAALARDSMTYWHDHYLDWAEAFDSFESGVVHKRLVSTEPCYTWNHARRAAVADVLGGVGAGAGGSVLYAFRIMSRSGIVAAMVVGSVGASVVQAGMEYYVNCLEGQ
jgi:hypothetical protein